MPRLVRRSLVRAFFVIPAFLILFSYCGDLDTPTEVPSAAPPISLDATPAGAAVLVGASDVATCSSNNDEATAKLLDAIDGTVMVVGDGAYAAGSAAEYVNCFGPTWGRHKARIRPAVGERDYATANAAGYFEYFGAAAGAPGEGWYSYELGEWHVVVLNSEASTKADSPQIKWLEQDLAASASACTIAYWHDPRFYSGGVRTALAPAWDVLYAAGAEVVVSGHSRFYERFAPQRPDEIADPAYGIRQFIIGLGGGGTSGIGAPRPNTEVADRSAYGVLKLTLGAGTYDWQFVPIAGKTFTDTGTGTCHGPPPPIANPGGPYASEAAISFDGRASFDLQKNYPLTYAWDFGDGTTGEGDSPSHVYALDGSYTATLTVTDALGNVSAPSSVLVTIANGAPVVTGGLDRTATSGDPVTISARFTDADVRDAPWQYQVAWGDGTTSDPVPVSSMADEILATHFYETAGDYTPTVSVTDADGATGSAVVRVHVRAPGTPVVLIGAGDIGTCTTKHHWDEETGKLLDLFPDATVFTTGDNAYPHGSATDYAKCYEPAWGRHKGRTLAAIGNHEYDNGNADPTWDYFGDRAGPRGKGYFSVDVGDWHIIVLNDNPPYVPIVKGSEQDLWLQADLANNTRQCTLALWHQPMSMSSNTGFIYRSSRKIIWDRLYAAGAEIVLNGHQHFYERFAPQTPGRVADESRGIRQFIIGTGGQQSTPPTIDLAPNSQVRGGAAGVLKLTLRSGGYDWEFVPAVAGAFADSGSGTCH